MKNIRLFWQIFLATMLIITGSILTGSWYGSSMVRSFYYEQMQEDIGNRALLLRPHILQLLNEDTRQLRIFCRRAGRAASTRITVIDGNGTVLADSNENPARMDNHKGRPEIQIAMQGKTGSSLRFSKTLSKTMLYVAIPTVNDQPQQGVLRLSVPATAMDAVLASIRTKIFTATLAIILLAAWLSYILARRISRPLEKIRQGAARLAAGESDHSIILEDGNVAREIAKLAVAFNTMGEQVNSRINMISQQRNELEAVFSSMTDGVLAIGSNHKIIRINKATANLFHIDGQAVQKKTYEGVIRNRELQQFLSNCLKQESIKTKDIVLQENGRNLSLRIHAVPLFDGESRRMGSLIILNDLTMLHELEHVRQDFVANVSHELKTPVTAIRGSVETLLDGAVDDHEAAGRFLRIINRQVMRLDAIIDDLLTLARIEDTAEIHDHHLVPEQICPILKAAVQACAVQAEQKHITLKMDCGQELIAPVNRTMLEQALINLLTNAITYSPKGKPIVLQADILPDITGKNRLRISVEDQGPGIAREHRERIFERFYRCDKARSRKKGGTGLGLAIVKHVAQVHNGEVLLTSTPGGGATFTLVFPADRQQ